MSGRKGGPRISLKQSPVLWFCNTEKRPQQPFPLVPREIHQNGKDGNIIKAQKDGVANCVYKPRTL